MPRLPVSIACRRVRLWYEGTVLCHRHRVILVDMNILPPTTRTLGCALAMLMLAACGTSPMRTDTPPSRPATAAPDNTRHAAFGPIRESVHRDGDDLVSAGLGLEGLRNASAPAFADPAAPTVAELRRRAIWSNWRGIADLRPGGGAGDELPLVPGREFATLARLEGANEPHRVVLQLPDAFDLQQRCVVVAVASGSRGPYGAIAVAAPWALPRGCALVHTDKGAGSDYFDLATGLGPDASGQIVAPGITPVFAPAQQAEGGIAFKHAHSRDNPEADWGRHVHQAAEFALHVLNDQYPEHAPFTAGDTRIIAVGISNGGGAVLRAAEIEDGLIDAIVAGEPNIHVDAPGSRPLYDYGSLAARLMPCALLALDDLPQPPLTDQLRALGEQRCASLHARGELAGADVAAQARDALRQLQAAGFDEAALRGGVSSVGFDLWRGVLAAYASAYGRFAPGEHPCGYRWALLDAQGQARAATAEEQAAWWSEGSGIPPGNGIALIDPQRGDTDPDLPGIDCLRALWEDDSEAARRVRAGVAETLAGLPREGLPVVIVHGQADGLIPMAFSSIPYAAMAQAAGREVVLWSMPKAQHFDAFLALPDYGARYVPLLPKVHAALDAIWQRLQHPDTRLPDAAP